MKPTPRSHRWQRNQKPNPNIVSPWAKAKQTSIQRCLRCFSVYLKKKKSPQYRANQNQTPANQTHGHVAVARGPLFVAVARSSSSSLARRHCRSPSSQIADCSALVLSAQCLVLAARTSVLPPSRYFSLFFSLTLSQSLSLSHWNAKMKWN